MNSTKPLPPPPSEQEPQKAEGYLLLKLLRGDRDAMQVIVRANQLRCVGGAEVHWRN